MVFFAVRTDIFSFGEIFSNFCREEKLDLPDDLLEGISGGYCGELIPTIFGEGDENRKFG